MTNSGVSVKIQVGHGLNLFELLRFGFAIKVFPNWISHSAYISFIQSYNGIYIYNLLYNIYTLYKDMANIESILYKQ